MLLIETQRAVESVLQSRYQLRREEILRVHKHKQLRELLATILAGAGIAQEDIGEYLKVDRRTISQYVCKFNERVDKNPYLTAEYAALKSEIETILVNGSKKNTAAV